MASERLQVVLQGRVQAVGFRQFASAHALELGFTGYVRNRWDRSVEVMAEGERVQLEQLLARLRRGPRAANVTQVEATWMPASGEFRVFEVRF